MKLTEYYNCLVSKLLSEQMTNGEFGLSRNTSVVDVVSPYHYTDISGRKANSFVTMYSIEVLHKLELDTEKVNKATSWFKSKISEDGYFLSDISISDQVEDLVTGKISTTQSTIKIYRHTAEALYSLFLIEGVNRLTIKILVNLLSAQNSDGGWSASSNNNNSQLLATAFTLKAITALSPADIAKSGFAIYDQEEKVKEIETAISLALRWFAQISQSVGGLWYLGSETEENKAFYTGIILGMCPKLFAENMPELTFNLISQLISCSHNGIWLRNNVIDIDGSARILTALVKLKKFISFDFDFELAFSTLQKKIEYSIETIDPATLCFLIDAIFEYDTHIKRMTTGIVNTIVAIYSSNTFLGSGFIVSDGTDMLCYTCKHIFSNVNTEFCRFVFSNGFSIESSINLKIEEKEITTDTFAREDIHIISLNLKNENFYSLKLQLSLSERSCSVFGYGASTKGRGKWNKNLTLVGELAKGFYEMNCSDGGLENGFSGSPIFNSKYEVIGMVQSIKKQTVYMIPSTLLKEYYNNWRNTNE